MFIQIHPFSQGLWILAFAFVVAREGKCFKSYLIDQVKEGIEDYVAKWVS